MRNVFQIFQIFAHFKTGRPRTCSVIIFQRRKFEKREERDLVRAQCGKKITLTWNIFREIKFCSFEIIFKWFHGISIVKSRNFYTVCISRLCCTKFTLTKTKMVSQQSRNIKFSNFRPDTKSELFLCPFFFVKPNQKDQWSGNFDQNSELWWKLWMYSI